MAITTTFRGLRFSVSEIEGSFRGIQFSNSRINGPDVRGFRFSSSHINSPSTRGLRFALSHTSGPDFRGIRFANSAENPGPALNGFRFLNDPLALKTLAPPITADALSAITRDGSATTADALSAATRDSSATTADALAASTKDGSATTVDALSASARDGSATTIDALSATTRDGSATTLDALSASTIDGIPFTVDGLSAKTIDGTSVDANALSATTNSNTPITGNAAVACTISYIPSTANALAAITNSNTPITVDALAASTNVNTAITVDAHVAGTVSGTPITADAAIATTNTNVPIAGDALVATTNVNTPITNDSLVAATTDAASFTLDALVEDLVENLTPITVDALVQGTFSTGIQSLIFSIVKDPSMRRARDIPTGFGILPAPQPFAPAKGRINGATASDGSVLTVWIQQDSLGNNRLCGRVDKANEENNSGSTLSSVFEIDGAKTAYIPTTNRWAIVWKKGAELRLSIYNKDLSTEITSGILISNNLPTVVPQPPFVITPDHFDIGVDNAGLLYTFYYNTTAANGEVTVVDTSNVSSTSQFLTANSSSVCANKMLVHRASGDITILYINSTDLKVDHYTMTTVMPVNPVGLPDTFTVDSNVAGCDIDHADILGRDGSEGFLVCWSSDVAGNNVHYRLFENGSFLAPTKTVAGTGHIALTGKSFNADISPIAATADHYSFFIKVADGTNPPNFAPFIWVQVKGPLGTMGTLTDVPTEQLIFVPNSRLVATPVIGINEFLYIHLYANGNNIAHDTYVNSSMYMGLWRIDRTARMFANLSEQQDSSSVTTIADVFQLYNDGLTNRFAGAEQSSVSNYETVRSVNTGTSASFAEFLGTLDEDTVFVGGPMVSEVANAMHTNTNVYNAQLVRLNPELNLASAAFSNTTAGNDGFALSGGPILNVTNPLGAFTQTRHANGPDIVDYALVMRLAVDVGSTQSTKSLIYIAGINRLGTKAAAYCVANPVIYRLGQSSACLVIIKYPASVTPDSYNPATDGTITIVPLDSVPGNDFEG